MKYDDWIFDHPALNEPDPCECGEDDCTCAEDAADEKGDHLLEQRRESEACNG